MVRETLGIVIGFWDTNVCMKTIMSMIIVHAIFLLNGHIVVRNTAFTEITQTLQILPKLYVNLANITVIFNRSCEGYPNMLFRRATSPQKAKQHALGETAPTWMPMVHLVEEEDTSSVSKCSATYSTLMSDCGSNTNQIRKLNKCTAACHKVVTMMLLKINSLSQYDQLHVVPLPSSRCCNSKQWRLLTIL